MNRLLFVYIASTIAFFFAISCTKVENSDDGFDDAKPVLKNEGSFPIETFYVLQSFAGIPDNSSILYPSMRELKPSSAVITANEAEEGFADISIDYEFILGDRVEVHTFSIVFENVPYSPDNQFSFNVEGISGICKADGQTALYDQVLLNGHLGEEDSHLYLNGVVNGFPFALDITSATTSRDSFVPASLEDVCRDPVPFKELDITNESSSEILFSIRNPWNIDMRFMMIPDETHIIQSYLVGYPLEIAIEIDYQNGKKLSLYEYEILSSDIFFKRSSENKWFLIGSPTGAIEPFWFEHSHYLIYEY